MEFKEFLEQLDSHVENELTPQEYRKFISSKSSLNSSDARELQAREQTWQQEYLDKLDSFIHIFTGIEPVAPPQTLFQLQQYLFKIKGKTIGDISESLGIEVISDLRLNTGWIGNLIETSLGAVAGSKPTQDFPLLGIELKTVSMSSSGKVLNDVFVSSLPLETFMLQGWETCHLLYKLQHVLFLPVENQTDLAIAERKIGQGVFWQPTTEQLNIIFNDWQQIMELITYGDLNHLKANIGAALCVRVKALSKLQSKAIIDHDGYKQRVVPLSFYLRRSFVQSILDMAYKQV